MRDVTSHEHNDKVFCLHWLFPFLLQPVVLPFSVSLFISFALSLVPISLRIFLSIGPLNGLTLWQYIYIYAMLLQFRQSNAFWKADRFRPFVLLIVI